MMRNIAGVFIVLAVAAGCGGDGGSDPDKAAQAVIEDLLDGRTSDVYEVLHPELQTQVTEAEWAACFAGNAAGDYSVEVTNSVEGDRFTLSTVRATNPVESVAVVVSQELLDGVWRLAWIDVGEENDEPCVNVPDEWKANP